MWNPLRAQEMVNSLHTNDVSEIYSPFRVTRMEAEMGLRAGWSLGITNVDEGALGFLKEGNG